MLAALVLPFVIEDDGFSRELLCKVRVYDDGKWVLTRLRWYPADWTYAEIEAEVAGTFDVQGVVVQRVLHVPEVRVSRHPRD